MEAGKIDMDMVAVAGDKENYELASSLIRMAESHACHSHAFFDFLGNNELNLKQIAALLRNYDAHASVLRRLLLKAATLMPEPAVPLVLENVRNEYGNGNYADNHQDQLRSLAFASGVTENVFRSCKIYAGVRDFIRLACKFYWPGSISKLRPAAVAAGAITATELLAIKEFACMQKAFRRRNLAHHIWFHHVSIEREHSDESLALAMYFSERPLGLESVEYGLHGILDANIRLYDGFLSALLENSD